MYEARMQALLRKKQAGIPIHALDAIALLGYLEHTRSLPLRVYHAIRKLITKP